MKKCLFIRTAVRLGAAAFLLMVPLSAYPGGYYVTDKDGKIISEDSGNTRVISPTEKTIVFTDSAERRIFDVQWDARQKTLTVRGDNVHLKIYSSGKIEKWSAEGGKEVQQQQYPIIIEPIVPVPPRQQGKQKGGG